MTARVFALPPAPAREGPVQGLGCGVHHVTLQQLPAVLLRQSASQAWPGWRTA